MTKELGFLTIEELKANEDYFEIKGLDPEKYYTDGVYTMNDEGCKIVWYQNKPEVGNMQES